MSKAAAAIKTNTSVEERRRELRVRPDRGTVVIQGNSFEIFDWSSSGLSMRGYDGTLTNGDRSRALVHIQTADKVFEFECELLFARSDSRIQLLAGVFSALARGDRKRIAEYFDALEQAAEQAPAGATIH